MAANGKLEGAIHMPEANWTLTLTDSVASGSTVTLAGDGYRYLSSAGDIDSKSLMTELADELSSVGDTYTVTLSSSTGKVTITNTDSPGGTTITWVDTDLRDVLGFTGNLSGADAYTSSNQARALWLPDAPPNRLNDGNWKGVYETDFRTNEAPDGSMTGLFGTSKRVLQLTWEGVSQEKTWLINEATTNESFERFLLDSIWGTSGFGKPTGPVKFHPDETDDMAFNEYRVGQMRKFEPSQFSQNYVGVWRIEIPRMVEVPS